MSRRKFLNGITGKKFDDAVAFIEGKFLELSTKSLVEVRLRAGGLIQEEDVFAVARRVEGGGVRVSKVDGLLWLSNVNAIMNKVAYDAATIGLTRFSYRDPRYGLMASDFRKLPKKKFEVKFEGDFVVVARNNGKVAA